MRSRGRVPLPLFIFDYQSLILLGQALDSYVPGSDPGVSDGGVRISDGVSGFSDVRPDIGRWTGTQRL